MMRSTRQGQVFHAVALCVIHAGDDRVIARSRRLDHHIDRSVDALAVIPQTPDQHI